MSTPHLLAKGIRAMYRHVVHNFLAVVTVPFAAAVLVAAVRFGPEEVSGRLREAPPQPLSVAAFLLGAAAIVYHMLRPRAVYMVDYACFRTAPNCRVPFSTFLEYNKQAMRR